MKKFKFIIIVICLLLWLVCSVPRRKIGKTIKTFVKVTGEATAVDNLIQKYEKEHQKFHREASQCGAYLEWPALNNKNLSDYCSNYLQHSIPTRTTNSIIGSKIRILLSYRKEYTMIKSLIVAVQCKVMRKNIKLSYYIARAPEKNCVYSLNRTRNKGFTLAIINKHCDFEKKTSLHARPKRLEIINMLNRRTGQPIAKDEYLLQYELEHQEMLEKIGKEGRCIEWPQAMTNPNLNSYCYQYMGECVPDRNRDGVTGSWKNEKLYKLHYHKLHTIRFVEVTIVICVPPKPSKLRYYVTRAPDQNCVYALVLRGHNEPNYPQAHFEIIFKHCDFEEPNKHEISSNNHENSDEKILQKTVVREKPLKEKITKKNHDVPVKNIFQKTEVKEEPLDILEPLHLFAQD